MATLPMGDAAANSPAVPSRPLMRDPTDMGSPPIARFKTNGMPPPLTENEKNTMAAQTFAMNRPASELFCGPIEEQPAGTLVDAVALVARAVTAKIAYHQTQIDALRRALRPFNEMSKHGAASAGASAGADEAVDQLLAIARKLGEG